MTTIGHNGAPDPIELVQQEYDGVILEAQNWADGEPVSDEASMKSVDEVIKEFKKYKTALGKAGKERTDPLHKAWKAEVSAVKVHTDDADLLQKALIACVAPFKAKLEEEKKQKEREAWAKAEAARLEAERAERAAQKGSIDDLREIEAARQKVIEAEKSAKAASKDKPKGMRTVTKYEINDIRAALHWIARNDKDAMSSFVEDYVRRNHKSENIDGVQVWTEKEAF